MNFLPALPSHQLSRRAVLRGLGVTMALPWLESLPVWGDEPAKGRSSTAPVRVAVLDNVVLRAVVVEIEHHPRTVIRVPLHPLHLAAHSVALVDERRAVASMRMTRAMHERFVYRSPSVLRSFVDIRNS